MDPELWAHLVESIKDLEAAEATHRNLCDAAASAERFCYQLRQQVDEAYKAIRSAAEAQANAAAIPA